MSLNPSQPVIYIFVLERFSNQQNRLLTMDRDDVTRAPTVEVTHEALIGSWARLSNWLHDEQEGLLLQRRLNGMATEWQEANKAPGLLATGMRLASFENWEKSTSLALNDLERNFLTSSLAAQQAQRRADEARKAREEETAVRAQKFQKASVVLGIMSVIAIVATLIALSVGSTARNTAAAVQADSTQLAADAAIAQETAVVVQAQSTQLAQDGETYELRVERVSTLAAGNIILGVDSIGSTPEAFLATRVANIELTHWQPQVQVFDGVEMVLVPAGCFWMGSIIIDTELPISEICLESSFWIDKYEVTNEQFVQYGGVAVEPPLWTEAEQPRTMVTWFEAWDYCRLRGGRLPTEPEWEYAARGVDGFVYPWGNEFDETRLASMETTEIPLAVGSFPSGRSWIGAYDMSGNAREFTSTKFSDQLADESWSAYEFPYDATDGREDSPDAYLSSAVVIRGGSFASSLVHLRASARNWSRATIQTPDYGFRCVRDF